MSAKASAMPGARPMSHTNQARPCHQRTQEVLLIEMADSRLHTKLPQSAMERHPSRCRRVGDSDERGTRCIATGLLTLGFGRPRSAVARPGACSDPLFGAATCSMELPFDELRDGKPARLAASALVSVRQYRRHIRRPVHEVIGASLIADTAQIFRGEKINKTHGSVSRAPFRRVSLHRPWGS